MCEYCKNVKTGNDFDIKGGIKMYCIAIKYINPNTKRKYYGYIGINSSDRPTFTDTINSKTDPLKLFATMHEAEVYWKEWKPLFANMITTERQAEVQIVEITLTEKVDLIIEY